MATSDFMPMPAAFSGCARELKRARASATRFEVRSGQAARQIFLFQGHESDRRLDNVDENGSGLRDLLRQFSGLFDDNI
jgi:hypothetical protein